MIYLGFILDYTLLFFCPIKTFFVINDIDKNDLLSVTFTGLILDFLYHKILLNLIILLVIYFIFKQIKFKKKYLINKNILLYGLYFNIMFGLGGYSFNYLLSFIGGLILQIIYIIYSKWLLK